MLFLKKLFGKDEKFFDLLEAGAEEARASVVLFCRHVQSFSGGVPVSNDEFSQSRRREKRLRQQMSEELGRTFITPLEREDIEALSFALYRIPKQVEKIVERIEIYPGKLPATAFVRQAELMLQAADAVLFMVKQLRHGTTMAKIQEASDRLQFAEGEADKVMITLLKDLYHGPCDAKELVVLQKTFEMVEQAVDRCRNAGNIVVQIVLKHS